MATKAPSKAEQRRAKRTAQRKAERRAKKKAAAKSRPKARKPKSRPKARRARSRGLLRRTAAGTRRLLGLGRRTTTRAAKSVPRRDRMRARRRRARNHGLAVVALVAATVLLIQSFSGGSVVVWLLAVGACILVFRPQRASRVGSQRPGR